MHRRGFAATALGFVLSACAGGYQPPGAVVQQHTYANCSGTNSQCRPRQVAAVPSSVSSVRMNVRSRADAEPAPSAFNGIPTIEVGQVCRGIDKQDTRAKEECLNTEQEVRNELVKKWAGFDTADRAHCASSMASTVPSYTELLTCLQMAGGARKLHEETEPSRDSLAIGQR